MERETVQNVKIVLKEVEALREEGLSVEKSRVIKVAS